MKIKTVLFAILLIISPIHGYCYSSDENAAVKIVKIYLSNLSNVDAPEGEYPDSRQYWDPDDNYPGSDSEVYTVVDKHFKVVKVGTINGDEINVTVQFKVIGTLSFFSKDRFVIRNALKNVTFLCYKSKSKYLITNTEDRHLFFYEPALRYIKGHGSIDDPDSLLNSMRKAVK